MCCLLTHPSHDLKAGAREPRIAVVGGFVEREIFASNPADSPRFKRYSQRPTRPEITLLTPAEIDATTTKLPNYNAIAIPIMAWFALPFGEVSELRVKDIDDTPDSMVIHIRRSAQIVEWYPNCQAGQRI